MTSDLYVFKGGYGNTMAWPNGLNIRVIHSVKPSGNDLPGSGDSGS